MGNGSSKSYSFHFASAHSASKSRCKCSSHVYQFFAWLLHCEQIHAPYMSRFSPHSCLRWQLSSAMTKSVRTPLHPALFLWWPWWRQALWVSRCWSLLTHSDVSPVPSHCIRVAHFRHFSYLLWSIFHLCLPLPFHIRLSGKDETISGEFH